jgi:lipoprotein-releasing system ATP-binding protein
MPIRAEGARSMSFLTIEALCKSYAVGEGQLPVLRGLDLAVDTGEMVAIVGTSGVGKSTLLQLVGGLDRIDGGTIQIGETDIGTADDDARVAFRNRQVGFVFQFHHLLPEFTAAENVAMPLRIARVARQQARLRAEALLAEVGLNDRLSHRPGMLSGGEQQRVAVARALVMQPALLLADEPTGDLDEQTAAELHGLLRRMHAAHGLTSLIATHNMQLAESCDRVLRLEAGRLRPA